MIYRLMNLGRNSKKPEEWDKIFAEQNPFSKYNYEYHKNLNFIEAYNAGIDNFIPTLLEGMMQFYNPPQEIDLDNMYLFVPPIYMGYEDLKKHYGDQIRSTFKSEELEQIEDLYLQYLCEKANDMTLYEMQGYLSKYFKKEATQKKILKYMTKKGNLYSPEVKKTVKFDPKDVKKNPYLQLIYAKTNDMAKVKGHNLTGLDKEVKGMEMFLKNLEYTNEFEKLIANKDMRDTKTLPEWQRLTDAWQILEKGLAPDEPLILTDLSNYTENDLTGALAVLTVLGHSLTLDTIKKLQKVEMKKWYKEHNVKSPEDLKEALKVYYGQNTTMSPEDMDEYIENIPYLKKRLGDTKGYYLFIPDKQSKDFVMFKKVVTLSEALAYMKNKFKYETAEYVAKPVTDKFGKSYILASYNTKNREEYFGYVVDQKYAQNYSEPAELFAHLSNTIAGIAQTKNMHEQNNWQVVNAGGFAWPINNRDLKFEIPMDITSYYISPYVESVKRFLQKNYYNAWVMSDDINHMTFTTTKPKEILLRLFYEITEMYTTGKKGIIYKTDAGITYGVYGLTKVEQQAFDSANGMDAMTNLFDNMQKKTNNLQRVKGAMPKFDNSYVTALLISRLKDEKAVKGMYFMPTDRLEKQTSWDVVKLRRDNKQLVVNTPQGMREYILLTARELDMLLKYMGVDKVDDLDYNVLTRKVRFFYDNIEIYRMLGEKYGHTDDNW